MVDDVLLIPRHLGIIVDGNRRWAKQHGLPPYEGHLAGHNTLLDILPEFHKAGVEFLSLYVFSTENWKRSKDEVSRLMSLIMKVFGDDLKLFHTNKIRIRVLGEEEHVPKKVLATLRRAEEETAQYDDGTVAVCFNYGGQREIVSAVKKIVQSGVSADEIDEQMIADNLYAPDIPPLDMVVRTSGEHRLSNFMLWRTAYSEFMFIDKPWPDMTKGDVKAIMKEYSRRHRRFGG
jgi:undecaprenyl diphosphate synthase